MLVRSMTRLFGPLFVICALLMPMVVADLAEAGDRKWRSWGLFSDHPKSKTYRSSKPQVRGYRRRVGGYSYSAEDSIGAPYRDYRHHGPFDSGFFFDSNFGSPISDAPYLN